MGHIIITNNTGGDIELDNGLELKPIAEWDNKHLPIPKLPKRGEKLVIKVICRTLPAKDSDNERD